MIIAIALAVLAFTDCLLCGFRGAAGTEGRLEKYAFYKSAIFRAFRLAIVIVGGHGLLTYLLVTLSADPAATWAAFLTAGYVAVAIYAAFATAIFIAFGFYFAPIGDFRVLTNVIVFGPLTILRPYFIAAGLAAGAYAAKNTAVTAVAISSGVTMLAFQRFIDREYRTRWTRLMRPRS